MNIDHHLEQLITAAEWSEVAEAARTVLIEEGRRSAAAAAYQAAIPGLRHHPVSFDERHAHELLTALTDEQRARFEQLLTATIRNRTEEQE